MIIVEIPTSPQTELDQFVALNVMGFRFNHNSGGYYQSGVNYTELSSFVPEYSQHLAGHALEVNAKMKTKDPLTQIRYKAYLLKIAYEQHNNVLDIATLLTMPEEAVARIISCAALLAVGVDKNLVYEFLK